MQHLFNLKPMLVKNDKKANFLIFLASVVVFAAVVALKYLKLDVDLGFNVHLLSTANATINGTVAVLLVYGLVVVKQGKWVMHRRVMFSAIVLSVLFLVCYIAYHILTEETKFPVDSPYRTLYLIILASHIVLAGLILPFILFTAYRALIGEYAQHKKLARWTWPVWFYVAVTGVIVYLMISPYYS